MKTAPFTMFGQTRMVPIEVYVDGEKTSHQEWGDTLWIERGEDWYAFMNPQYKGKRVRVVTREAWLRSAPVGPNPT